MQNYAQLFEVQMQNFSNICATMNHIGKILQEKMNEDGRPTMKDFASLCGISTRTLYNIMQGSSEMTLPQVVKASEILKFDLIGAYLRMNDKVNVLKEPEGGYETRANKQFTVSLHLTADMIDSAQLPMLLAEVSNIALKHKYRLM